MRKDVESHIINYVIEQNISVSYTTFNAVHVISRNKLASLNAPRERQ